MLLSTTCFHSLDRPNTHRTEFNCSAFSDSLRAWQVRVSLTGSVGYLGLVLLQLQSHLFFWDEFASDKASADASQGDLSGRSAAQKAFKS